MGRLLLIIGGARSGKSSYAIKLAKQLPAPVAFVATATASDQEMRKRIRLHRSLRPRVWKLIEETKDVDLVLSALKNKYKVILVDCLGLLIANLMAANLSDRQILDKVSRLVATVLKMDQTTILVSNEVGTGIVPENPLARRFRDILGLANQGIAKRADQVIFMQAGIPMIIKGKEVENGPA